MKSKSKIKWECKEAGFWIVHNLGKVEWCCRAERHRSKWSSMARIEFSKGGSCMIYTTRGFKTLKAAKNRAEQDLHLLSILGHYNLYHETIPEVLKFLWGYTPRVIHTASAEERRE